MILIYNRGLCGIVLPLCMLDKRNDAKAFAMRIENESERDDALCRCLDGEEKIIHSQKAAEKYLNRFLFQPITALPHPYLIMYMV